MTSDTAGKIVQLLLDASPVERAEVFSIVRGKTVETKLGVFTRADFEAAIRASRTLDETAVRLGICRRTLQYHMRILGVPKGGGRSQ